MAFIEYLLGAAFGRLFGNLSDAWKCFVYAFWGSAIIVGTTTILVSNHYFKETKQYNSPYYHIIERDDSLPECKGVLYNTKTKEVIFASADTMVNDMEYAHGLTLVPVYHEGGALHSYLLFDSLGNQLLENHNFNDYISIYNSEILYSNSIGESNFYYDLKGHILKDYGYYKTAKNILLVLFFVMLPFVMAYLFTRYLAPRKYRFGYKEEILE